MKIIIYDTETTWLMNSKEKDLNKQPHLVQFAWIIWEVDELGNWEKEKEINIYIKPPIPMPYEASLINHIYDIDLLDKLPIEDHIEEICNYINWVDLVIGHNVEFDNRILWLEVQRAKMKWLQVDFQPKNIFCTMNWTIEICRLKNKPSDIKFKRPKLWELYNKLFWESFSWAHDALQDVKATWRCFIELFKNGKIRPFKNANKITLF